MTWDWEKLRENQKKYEQNQGGGAGMPSLSPMDNLLNKFKGLKFPGIFLMGIIIAVVIGFSTWFIIGRSEVGGIQIVELYAVIKAWFLSMPLWLLVGIAMLVFLFKDLREIFIQKFKELREIQIERNRIISIIVEIISIIVDWSWIIIGVLSIIIYVLSIIVTVFWGNEKEKQKFVNLIAFFQGVSAFFQEYWWIVLPVCLCILAYVSRKGIPFSILGTGARPLYIGEGIGGTQSMIKTSKVSFTCPACGSMQEDTANLYRNYLTILYAPIFPFSLCSLYYCTNCKKKVHLSTGSWGAGLMGEAASLGGDYSLGIESNYFIPLLASAIGSLLGYALISKFFELSLPIYFLLPILLFMMLYYVVSTLLWTTILPLSGDVEDNPLILLSLLPALVSPLAIIFLTILYGQSYPTVFGILWGACLGITLYRVIVLYID